jgi:hypothetical protein
MGRGRGHPLVCNACANFDLNDFKAKCTYFTDWPPQANQAYHISKDDLIISLVEIHVKRMQI